MERPAHQVLPASRLRDVALGRADAADQLVLAGERVLVVNRMTVSVRGERVGAVVTLRDRAEQELLRELASVRSLADGLRAQAHEFFQPPTQGGRSGRAVRHADAVRFITKEAEVHQSLSESLLTSVGQPTVTALLLAKSAVASERGIALRIDPDSYVAEDLRHADDLVTIVGNLVENAFEALAPASGPVEVLVRTADQQTTVRVRDDGPGVDPAVLPDIFRDGFSPPRPPPAAGRAAWGWPSSARR